MQPLWECQHVTWNKSRAVKKNYSKESITSSTHRSAEAAMDKKIIEYD